MKKLHDADLGILMLSLSHLLHAGVGTADAFYLLSEDTENREFRQRLQKMAKKADAGGSLADCFGEDGGFPGYLCTLVKVGEQVGKVEETLTRLGQYYNRMAQLKRQLRSALLYPAILLLVLFGVLTVLFVWVLPIFSRVYDRLGGSLGSIGEKLMLFGQGLGAALPWIGGTLGVLALVFLIPITRKWILTLWQRCFGDRGVQRSIHNSRFMEALTLGITSGMTQEEAVKLASTMAGKQDLKFSHRCALCQSRLGEGKSLASALKESKILIPAESRLLEAALRGGQTPAALSSISERMMGESQEKILSVAERIEPAAVIVACTLIGLILLSTMLPLMNIMNTMG